MAKDIGKVAVLMGGWSAERNVSLSSGSAVLAALTNAGVDAHGIDVGRDIADVLTKGQFDCAFNMVHGRGGEDGVLQGVLETLQLPYTGCGILASAISMDKLVTKRMWQAVGLPTAKYKLLTADSDFDAVVDELGLPLIVKPALEGSSIGMSKVEQKQALQAAYELAAPYGEVFVEEWLSGDEFTVALLDGEVLPPIRLEVQSAFYDYEAKYQSNDTQYHCPCGLNRTEETTLKQLAKQAFNTVQGKGWGRVDVMQNTQGDFVLIEVNTVPGMTDHSLVPMAAKAIGLSFEQLVVRIVETIGST
ncbi:MAG TPA: D-alanine--D-alanine ligase [Thiothrix sp.]|nr:D-alanine--D-alanine ligase [Thiothrix sp.]